MTAAIPHSSGRIVGNAENFVATGLDDAQSRFPKQLLGFERIDRIHSRSAPKTNPLTGNP